MRECVVIGLPADEVDVFLILGNVRAKNLPVEAAVLEPNFAVQCLDEMVADLRAASEHSQLGVALLQDLLLDGAVGVHEIQVGLREAAV